MGKIGKNLKTLAGAILGLTILLIILFYVLNFVNKRGPAPLSTLAGNIEARANGSIYNGN